MVKAELNQETDSQSIRGLCIPLSDVFLDTHRSDSYPTAERVTKLFTRALDCIPPGLLTRVRVRGSTSLYGALQQQGAHRRGTISAAFMTLLDREIRQVQSLPEMAKALSDMEFGPDIDMFIENADESEFGAIAHTMQDSISKKFNHFPHSRIIGPNSPTSKKRGVSLREVKLQIKRSKTPGGVDNLFVDINSAGHEKGDVVPLGHLYFAADYHKYNQSETFDTRRDQNRALSWDLCSGRVEKRGKDYFIVYDEENIKKITSPITVGPEFSSLPASQRFLLLLRAAQKGAMAENVLTLSPEGKKIVQEREGNAAAIDVQTIERLKREISPEELQIELTDMGKEQRFGFEAYIRQYMLTGLFYPHKFNEYCRELGIYRFFPYLNMSDDQSRQLGEVMENTMPWKEYERRLYISTHPYDAWYTNRLWRVGEFDIKKTIHDHQFYEQLNQFVNPFELFLSGLNTVKLPGEINPTNSIFFELNKLFQLSQQCAELLPEDALTELLPLRSDEDLRKIFEYDTKKLEIIAVALISLIESFALVAPILTEPATSVFNSPEYIAGVHASVKILIAIMGFSGLQALEIALGKYSVKKHIKRSGTIG